MIWKLISLGFLLFSLGLCPAAVAQQPQKPIYEALKTTVAIQVDGRLDEPVWSAVPAVGPFRDNRSGNTSALDTDARITYDDAFVYFAFRCPDTNVWSTRGKRDMHLWEEEVVEVFIQASPTHPSYIELEVNPLGAMLDIFLIDIRKPIPYESWNSARLKWAVQVDGTVDGQPGDKGWTCEIALPFEDVITAPNLPPKPGDRWRVNLYRVESKPNPVGLAWSPTGRPDFHVPSMFGELVFSGKTAK